MEGRLKVFPEQYNKVLELVEKVDPILAKAYSRVMNIVPEQITDKLSTKKSFYYSNNNASIAYEFFENMMEFELTRKEKYFCVAMNVYPFYEDELMEGADDWLDGELTEDEQLVKMQLAEDDGNLFLFSLAICNTRKEPSNRIDIVEKDGEYKMVGDKAFEWEVFIEKDDDNNFSLTSKQTLNGVELYKKELPIAYEELIKYANDEELTEDYEADLAEDYDDDDEIFPEYDGGL